MTNFAAELDGSWRLYNPAVIVFNHTVWATGCHSSLPNHLISLHTQIHVFIKIDGKRHWNDACPDDTLYSSCPCPTELNIQTVNWALTCTVDSNFSITSNELRALPHKMRYQPLVKSLPIRRGHYDRLMAVGAGLKASPLTTRLTEIAGDSRAFIWQGRAYLAFHATPEHEDLMSGLYYNQMHVRQVLPNLSAPVQLRAPGIINGSSWEKNWFAI